MSKTYSDEQLENLIIKKMDILAKSMTLDDYDDFAKNLIAKYNINYQSYEGFCNVMRLSESAVFLNYFTNIQFTIFKNNLNNKLKEELTDEEALNVALKTFNSCLNIFSAYKCDQLNVAQRANIYKNMNNIVTLYDVGFFDEIKVDKLSTIIRDFKEYDYSKVTNKFSTLRNIKSKEELNKIGLQEFSESQLRRVIKK